MEFCTASNSVIKKLCQKVRQKFSVIITNTCVPFCLQYKMWIKMPNELFFLISSEVFVLITENFWRIFWRTLWRYYLTPYKTPTLVTKSSLLFRQWYIFLDWFQDKHFSGSVNEFRILAYELFNQSRQAYFPFVHLFFSVETIEIWIKKIYIHNNQIESRIKYKITYTFSSVRDKNKTFSQLCCYIGNASILN